MKRLDEYDLVNGPAGGRLGGLDMQQHTTPTPAVPSDTTRTDFETSGDWWCDRCKHWYRRSRIIRQCPNFHWSRLDEKAFTPTVGDWFQSVQSQVVR
ncbi:hypothetical protein ACQUFY_10875 [Robbsia andropogonis]|uniref:hypothetical protein n=1 Tax=Robbsia andropogonis TaxID=28092 RepID=UPI003D1D18E1